MSEWYYKSMSEVFGPYSAAELKHQADVGRIQPDTLIRKNADGKWVMAHNIRGLFTSPKNDSQVPEPPPVVPPTPSKAQYTDVHILRTKTENKRNLFAILTVILLGMAVAGVAFWLLRPVSRESIVANSVSAVAQIRGNVGQGTGFMVGPRLMVTNRHVIAVEPDSQLQVTFPSQLDKSTTFTARVIYEHPDADLALLEISVKQHYLKLASRHEFTRGGEVTVIGNPGLGKEIVLDNAVSRGLLSTKTMIDGNEYYQLDISINPGNSGGPAIDASGRVIGVVTLRAASQEGLGFCIPLATLKSAVTDANNLTENDKAKNSSTHNLHAVVRLIDAMAKVYEVAMAAYLDSMTDSIGRGGSATSGLAEVQPSIDRLVRQFDDATIGKIEAVVNKLGADPNIADSVRQNFVAAWTNYKELQSYVGNPRGNVDSYRAKYHELSDNHHRLIESLKLLAGVKTTN